MNKLSEGGYDAIIQSLEIAIQKRDGLLVDEGNIRQSVLDGDIERVRALTAEKPEPRTSGTLPPTRCCRRLVGRDSIRFLCRQDAGSTLVFMESFPSPSRMHRGHEPGEAERRAGVPPAPSAKRTAAPITARAGALAGQARRPPYLRFMEWE